jgi:hypothetical protein
MEKSRQRTFDLKSKRNLAIRKSLEYMSKQIAPVGRLISRIAGVGFVAAGAWLVVGSS